MHCSWTIFSMWIYLSLDYSFLTIALIYLFLSFALRQVLLFADRITHACLWPQVLDCVLSTFALDFNDEYTFISKETSLHECPPKPAIPDRILASRIQRGLRGSNSHALHVSTAVEIWATRALQQGKGTSVYLSATWPMFHESLMESRQA